MLGSNNNSYNSGSNSNNNGNKPYNPTVYSNYRSANFETAIGTVSLRYSFWMQHLRITITPMINNNGSWSYDENGIMEINLNHTKARILAQEIRNFLRDSRAFNGVGVSTTSRDGNSTVVTISDGSDYNIQNPVLSIRKIDSDGKIVANIGYPFRTDYFYSIRNIMGEANTILTPDTMQTCSSDYANIEIEELLSVLDSYVEAMTNSLAYAVVDQSKWDFFRLSRKLDAISENLGINTSQSSGRSGGFFNNGGNKTGYKNQYTNVTDDSYDID